MKSFFKTKILSDEATSFLFLTFAFFVFIMSTANTNLAQLGAIIFFNLLGLIYGIRALKANKKIAIIAIILNIFFVSILLSILM